MSFPLRPLSELAEIQIGPFGSLLHKSDYIEDGVPVINPMHIAPDGISADPSFSVADEKAQALSRYLLSPGEVIMGRRGEMGRCAIVKPEHAGMICGTGSMKIAPESTQLHPEYLVHILRTPKAKRELENVASGITMLNLNAKALASLEVPLPPLEEQRRIAGILDQADALRRLRTRALDKLNTLGQAIFHEMFVQGADEDWPKVQVDDLIDNARTGPFGSQLLHSEFTAEGIPVLGIDNVVQNRFVWAKERFIPEAKYSELKRYTVLPGDVLITIMGTVGRCAIVPNEIPTAINTKHLCCLTLNQERATPEFLKACFLAHPDVLRQLGVQAKGAVMPGLNMGIIKALKLQLPPLALQKEFAQKLEAVEKQAQDYEGSTAFAETMFASLQQQAFRGKL